MPIIRDLPEFKWLASIKTDPSQRNKSLQCEYHRNHGHKTDRCRSLKFLVEKLITAGHLRRYIRELDHEVELEQAAKKITIGAVVLSESRSSTNYILGGPFDDQYQSKRQQKKLLRAATVKARVNAIHMEGRHEKPQPIDGPISFLPINSNRIIVPHYDALVLTLCINDFDVHRVLVDPGSAADLLPLPTFKQMKLFLGVVNSVGRILSGFNGVTTVTLGDVALPIKAGPVTQ